MYSKSLVHTESKSPSCLPWVWIEHSNSRSSCIIVVTSRSLAHLLHWVCLNSTGTRARWGKKGGVCRGVGSSSHLPPHTRESRAQCLLSSSHFAHACLFSSPSLHYQLASAEALIVKHLLSPNTTLAPRTQPLQGDRRAVMLQEMALPLPLQVHMA